MEKVYKNKKKLYKLEEKGKKTSIDIILYKNSHHNPEAPTHKRDSVKRLDSFAATTKRRDKNRIMASDSDRRLNDNLNIHRPSQISTTNSTITGICIKSSNKG